MGELPEAVADEAARLTRLARGATDEAEARAYRDERDRLLADHGYRGRVREADEALVCYPAGWAEDGRVRTDRIDDLDRAVERPLRDGAEGEPYEAVAAHNRALVERVVDTHGAVHGANAAAFAAFMGNHYARRVEAATDAQIREFLVEYYPRNAWPSEAEAAAVEESLRRLFEIAGRPAPEAVE